MKTRFWMIFVLLILVIAWSVSGWAKGPTGGELRISIAEQYGLAYAPVQVMKELKLLEKNLPGIKTEWKQLSNTAVIREAMLAGRVDVGFIAIPPFLIGWDKGMPWKMASGLSESPVGLVTWKKGFRSLKDFTKIDRIAAPQPGSVQHILLAMACEREFGDAKKFDNQLVTLAHPDGMSALLAKKEISAHFTAPPYLMKELEQPGMTQVLSGAAAFGGEFTFIVGVTTEGFHDQNPRVYQAYVKSLHQAMDYVRKNPKQTASLLSAEYRISEAELLKYLQAPGMNYRPEIKGIKEFAAFMKRNGYISKIPQKTSEILWENVNYEE